MTPWPLVPLSLLLRLVILPIIAWRVFVFVCQQVTIVDPNIVLFLFAGIVINLLVWQIHADSRRIGVLEENICELKRRLSNDDH
jgi:hypothetical protein